MKHYRLLVTAYKRVIVKNCENVDEAADVVDRMMNAGDFEIEEIKLEGSAKASELEGEERSGTEIYDAKED